jgi:hypothetical protein
MTANRGSTATKPSHYPWCDESLCETVDTGQCTHTHHESGSRLIRVRGAVLDVQLWQTDPHEPSPKVSIRQRMRQDESGLPLACNDPHFVVTLYTARLLHRALGDLLAAAERAVEPVARAQDGYAVNGRAS